MNANVGTIDRIVRAVLGIVLIAAPFLSDASIFQSSGAMIVAIAVGVVMLATSAMRFCPLYRVIGIGTRKT